ncbi:EamA family transporter RarD [Anoxybacillus sp. LAT_35]|uniref:EamA family transporter RarD n=1 Tax=Anoxybacillus TaxID=150247 RepID=UPI001EDA6562|nr:MULTISPECIES: EamA family transporter RarD [Anoxybacillus]MCG5026469.1 EamA family transporter RarD [Anoxybacillus flavithermus]MCG6196776.1 EamA family transporter RarD [Anoxybacillus sp. LAT_38]MCG3085087.1 EamA family transporter RarD [Anoxybacillus sp. LAT27]MCG6171109.1 EamA family transporter RarD [Anoxybacillus sp. LAT_11]MCG6176213.1 EamA family transporter RarD [Anoxybacillus sp. LAT_31]
MENKKIGAIYALFAYVLWGILPLYWKMLQHIRAEEILSYRIVTSFLFMVALLFIQKSWSTFLRTCQWLWKEKKQAVASVMAAFLISANWFIYIWAVNHDHMIEASLGYYMNPLLNVVLGVIVLKERLYKWQVVSFILAAVGVVFMTVEYGKFPWIALSLACSFALYGLVKKVIKVDATIGLTIETMFVAPFALAWIIHSFSQWHGSSFSLTTMFLLAGAGPATALPLLYFSKGAQHISLTVLGFLQYISPTLSLLLGVFLFHEPFTNAHMYAFSCIWTALLLFSLSSTWEKRREKSLNV